MIAKKSRANRLKSAIFGVFFAVFGFFGLTTISAFVNPEANVYAEPVGPINTSTSNSTSDNSSSTTSTSNNSGSNSENSSDTTSGNTNENSDNSSNENSEDSEKADTCEDQIGALGWFICPGVGVLSKAIDSIYSQIETLLAIDPISVDGTSSIFYIWQIMRDITNILFVVVLLIAVYSQVTGIGITNYGIKKALPKLIIAAVLVNLSYILCALAVDVSNILGSGLRGLFDNIQLQAINAGGIPSEAAAITWSDLATALISGGVVAGFVISASSLLFPILGAIFCAIISVLVGLITLGLRQSLVSVLIMIAPVAFICYLLPNTEKWFSKWKDIFISMLIFYPLFSLLFGASRLAGWAMITTSIENDNAFGIAIGMVVQVLPLILSISLMKMSNTILGKASGALDKLANYPRDGIRKSAEKFRALSRDRHVNYSPMPSAHLQRFLDKRNRKLELDTENERKIRVGRAEIWAQRKVLGNQNYDPAHDDEYKNGGIDKNGKRTGNKLHTSRSTRAAKEAMSYSMEAENAARDTAHVLGNYTDYHNGTKRDIRIGKTAAKNFVEYTRTLHVEENDSFADQDWLMGQYDKIRKAGEDSYAYKHYIVGGAGSLGKAGESLVLGEVIAKSAVNEQKRKNYTGLNFMKYGYNKKDARDCIVGYAVDDDGYAVDKITRKPLSSYTDPKTGKTIKIKERQPGEFLKYHPEYLEQCAYTLKDERGYYFNATDQDGKFVSRIYKSDGAAIKEIFQNWDMPIGDPINGLYGMLSGVKPGSYKEAGYPLLEGVGLSNFSTTLDRAIKSSGFKEKAAFASPLYSTMVGHRDIKDIVHQNLARLDSLLKTAKPSNFNTQDSAEFKQLAMLMNPENWSWMLFDEDSLRSFRNVNRDKLTGTRYKLDADGNYIKKADGTYDYDVIAADSEDLTFDDLKNTVIRKFLAPAGPKFASLFSRMTPNVKDNQKPSVAEPLNDMYDAMETWNNDEYQKMYPGLNDPYAVQANDTLARSREISRRISPNKNSHSSKSSGANQPATFEPGQEIFLNQPSNPKEQNTSGELVKTSPDLQSRKRSAEDRANDRAYRKYEQTQAWSTYKQGSQSYQSYINDIEALRDTYNNNSELFIDAAKSYLDNACAQDDRINNVLDDFNLFITGNYGDNSLESDDYADELLDILAVHTYEE